MGRPGKFEGVPNELVGLAERLSGETPDSEAALGGEAYVDWYGFYVLEDDDAREYGWAAAILHEDNDGFVTLALYATEERGVAEMGRLQELEGEMLS